MNVYRQVDLNSILYWMILIISIIGNFIVSIVLVPFLLVLQGFALYLTLFTIGLSFGWYFTFLIRSIEKIKTGPRIIASVFIPAIALINIIIIVLMSNKLILLLDLRTGFHSPIFVGAAYVFAYVLPGTLMQIFKKF